MDALKLIQQYDHQDVLMYLDPPYVLDTRRGKLYSHEMNDAEQQTLLQIITDSKAHIVISGYESDLYNTVLKGWNKDSTKSQTASGKMAIETIWMNYDPPVKQYSFF